MDLHFRYKYSTDPHRIYHVNISFKPWNRSHGIKMNRVPTSSGFPSYDSITFFNYTTFQGISSKCFVSQKNHSPLWNVPEIIVFMGTWHKLRWLSIHIIIFTSTRSNKLIVQWNNFMPCIFQNKFYNVFLIC